MPKKRVIAPIEEDTLTSEDKEQELYNVNTMKEKLDGMTKFSTCDNGSKQRKYLKEGESVSPPTVLIEARFTTLVVN